MNDGDDHMEGPGGGFWIGMVVVLWVVVLTGTLLYLGTR